MEDESPNGAVEMSFGEHLIELRRLMVRAAILFLIVAIVLFVFKGFILDVIFAPLSPDFISNQFFEWLSSMTGVDALRINQTNVELYNNRMAGQFSLHVKSAIIGGLVISFPYIIWQLWSFVRPALSQDVQDKCKRIVWEISMWFFIGLLFGYYCISPLAVDFLTSYEVSPTIKNIIDVSSFMSTVMGVTFAAALIFQLPLLVRLLANIGLMKAALMRKYRRFAIVGLLFISALITPPDIFSQILIFLPMYALYEYGIIIAARIEKRKAEENGEN